METNSQSTPVLPIDEYCRQERISRRTACRYAADGKIVTKRIKGRTYVYDLPPGKAPVETEPGEVAAQVDNETGHLATRNEQLVFELGKLTVEAACGKRWRLATFAAIGVCFVAIIAGTFTVAYFFAMWQGADRRAGDLAGQIETIKAAAQLPDNIVPLPDQNQAVPADINFSR